MTFTTPQKVVCLLLLGLLLLMAAVPVAGVVLTSNHFDLGDAGHALRLVVQGDASGAASAIACNDPGGSQGGGGGC